MVGKVCVIGAGPSGLGILCWFAKQKREGKVVIIINIVVTVQIAPEEEWGTGTKENLLVFLFC